VDISLAYGTDVEQAKKVIEEAAGQVASAPENTASVIGEPDVWGIHSLSGDEIVFRVVQKVKAGQSDGVARDLRSYLKKSLDGAGIALASKQAIYVAK
jgi:small conductance mechanosensitive channel